MSTVSKKQSPVMDESDMVASKPIQLNPKYSNQEQIFSDRLLLLNQNLFTSIPIAFICASIMYATLKGVINNSLLNTWFSSVIVVFLVRFLFYKLYQRSPYQERLHMRLFILGITLTAMLWGFAGFFLIPTEYFLHQTVLIVILAGIVAGGMQTLQSSLVASLIYVLVSLIPLNLWLVMQGTKIYYLLAIAVLFYIIFMALTAKRGYELIISAYRLRYENININSQLEQTNKKLIAEVIYHEQNEKSLAQLASIVEFSRDAIIGMDIKGDIQSWNKGAETLYGFHSNEVMGQSIKLITIDSQGDMLDSMFAKVKQNHSFQGVELARKHKDGHVIPVSVTLSALKNEKGRVIGISSLDRDISEQKELERIKNEFVSVVSHELRTPLTSIKGSLGILLAQEREDCKAKQLLQIAYNNCERLIRLINDILDIEKIESGKIEFKFKKLNFKDLLNHAVEENKSFAEKYQVEIRITNNQDAIVYGDFDRLIQVMTNLISNAVKFSKPQSFIEVGTIVTNARLKVCVKDYGEGIPKEFQAKLFERFTQADSSTTRTKGGTGLGLSISKAILEFHHSHLNFVTQAGEGTTFYFELPIQN